MDDLQTHARTALEQVCARGDLDRAHELYAERFIDHVNALDFHGQAGIAQSIALYRAIFPDLEIRVVDQLRDGDCASRARRTPATFSSAIGFRPPRGCASCDRRRSSA